MSAMPKHFVPLIATAFVMLFLWLSSVPLLSWYEFSAQHQKLADESFQWHQQRISNYNYEFEHQDLKFRPISGPVRIHVRDSKILAAFRVESDDEIDISGFADVPETIESAFAIVSRLLEEHPYEIDITYDTVLHYPRKITVSYSDQLDDGSTYFIRMFERAYDSP